MGTLRDADNESEEESQANPARADVDGSSSATYLSGILAALNINLQDYVGVIVPQDG